MNVNNIVRISGMLSVFPLLVMLLIFPAASQDVPEVPNLPMGLYGNIQVNDEPAPIGTIISAYAGEEFLGSTELQNEGTYGESSLTQLVINEPSSNNYLIEFYFNTPSMPKDNFVAAKGNVEWQSKKIVNIDLSGDYVEGSTDTTKKSGSSRSSFPSITGDDTPSEVDEAMPGGSGVDVGIEDQESIPSSQEETPTTTEKDGLSPFLIIVIGIVAVVILIYYFKSKNNSI